VDLVVTPAPGGCSRWRGQGPARFSWWRMRTVFLSRRFRSGRVYRKTQWVGVIPWTLVVLVGEVWWRMCSQRHKGTWVTGRRTKGGIWVARERPSTRGRVRVKRVKQAGTGDASQKHLAALESVLFGKLQAIVSHLAITQYDDGAPRRPGWITLKTLGAAWVVEAKDPDSCCKLSVVQNTLDDALAALCLLLESEEAPWEPDPWLQQKKPGKKGG